ncbi:hypothetical protein JOM56_009064 [Amanita muscaria]
MGHATRRGRMRTQAWLSPSHLTLLIRFWKTQGTIYPGMEVNEQQTTSDHQANALNVASPVSVMTSNTGTLVNAATTDSQGKGKKTGGNRKKRVYPNSTKPEHLFAADFQKLHGGNATTEQFNIAWQALSAEEKLSYQTKSATLTSEVRNTFQLQSRSSGHLLLSYGTSEENRQVIYIATLIADLT